MVDRCRTTIATKYPGFQFHGSDTIFKLINNSFFINISHSFMYRVYIEGDRHSKNGKE